MLADRNARPHALPSVALWTLIIVGLILFAGSLMVPIIMFFAGWWTVPDPEIWAFLIVGPMSFLPASVLTESRPRAGGALFLASAIASAVLAPFVMNEPGEMNTFSWSASLVLIVPLSLPMFILGIWLLKPIGRRAA